MHNPGLRTGVLLVTLSCACCFSPASVVAATDPDGAANSGDFRGEVLEQEREALLAAHEKQREVHMARDAEGFQALLADSILYMQQDGFDRRTREQNLARIRAYFSAVEFLEWDDIIPPEITISEDGTLATIAVHKRVTLVPARASAGSEDGQESSTAPDPAPQTTIFTWIATYKKIDGRWLVIQVAGTRADAPQEESEEAS